MGLGAWAVGCWEIGTASSLLQRIALATAGSIGMLGFLRVMIEFPALPSALAVALSLFTVALCSVFLGIFLNLALHGCGVDPATAGAPMVSTIADLSGIIILCLVSSAILSKA